MPDEFDKYLVSQPDEFDQYKVKPIIDPDKVGVGIIDPDLVEKSILSEARRIQLDGIVNQMIQNKEPEENIQWVVNDFKSKYGGPPTKPQQPKEGFSFSKMLGNIPSSGIEFGKNILSAITSPVQTTTGIAKLAKGTDVKLRELMGQKIPPEQAGLKQYPDAFYQEAIVKRYGSLDNFLNTLQTDPVGVAADASVILSGTGAGLKVAGLAKAGKVASTVGELANPAAWPGKAAGGIRELLGRSNLPESIYARSLKIPPGSLKEEGRANVIETLVRDEKLPLGKGTRAEINSIIKELDDGITKTLDDLSSSGSQFSIDTISIALDNFKDNFSNRPNPQRYYNAIDKVKKDFIEHDFVARKEVENTILRQSKIVNETGKPFEVPETVKTYIPDTINLSDAQALKKGTYAELEQYYTKGQKPETGRVGIRNDVEAAGKAKVAQTLRNSILSSPDVPESVRTDLSREAGLMAARKWVERAANRGQNLDPISLGGMAFGILIEGGVPGAVAYKIATSQSVQSRLALFIAHGSEKIKALGEYGIPTTLGAYQAGKVTGLTPQIQENEYPPYNRRPLADFEVVR
jgi:hypothetical protein